MAPILYLVVPCYNEEQVLPLTSRVLREKMESLITRSSISPDSRILLVDDGSRDSTWPILCSLRQESPLFAAMKLSHNRGHQNALLAGLMTARHYCDAAVSLDADLQDDIEAVDGFLEKFGEGCDVVYGVRRKRDTDTVFKRSTARWFYKLMNAMGAETVENHADYRLMSRRALESLSEYEESNLFLRGVVPLIGYRSDVVYYDRAERAAGTSKYPLGKMLSFALEGITSFSVRPLRIITVLGMIVALISVLGLLYALISKLVGSAVAGWTAIVSSIWFLGGLQMLCLGVCGEYIGKIYSEVKHRPRYTVEQLLLTANPLEKTEEEN
ncbi:MAG: glycosyltransferase family 2 protein [Clostridiales bacterium]|jgi:glycosyltransferase involved in cell wall biosynthesis|nr:glycosyltransferase family 2 protein [Clostridiales bacterium]